MNFPTILVDRTALIAGEDRLTIQKVTPDIYDASYPAWFLSQERVQRMIESAGYTLQAEWEADRLPLDGKTVAFKGAFYVKNGARTKLRGAGSCPE
jgi:putative methyltransferase (TIGR04325 family)